VQVLHYVIAAVFGCIHMLHEASLPRAPVHGQQLLDSDQLGLRNLAQTHHSVGQLCSAHHTGKCAPTPPDTWVLFLGDSVDRTIIKHACQAAAGLQDSQARRLIVTGVRVRQG
jgi:hypothetical protein